MLILAAFLLSTALLASLATEAIMVKPGQVTSSNETTARREASPDKLHNSIIAHLPKRSHAEVKLKTLQKNRHSWAL